MFLARVTPQKRFGKPGVGHPGQELLLAGGRGLSVADGAREWGLGLLCPNHGDCTPLSSHSFPGRLLGPWGWRQVPGW